MMDPYETFLRSGAEALRNFHVVDRTDNRIEAEADTGSRYVVYRVEANLHRAGGTHLVVVRWPWQAMHEISECSYMVPEYLVDHFGVEWRGHDLSRYNGGDVYALLECFAHLMGTKYPDPISELTKRGFDVN